MPGWGLYNSNLKISRAKEHLESLGAELAGFQNSDVCSLSVEEDLEHQWLVLRLAVALPPDRLAIIVGDFIYCLRSALDQLVWELARLSDPVPSKKIQFPIHGKNRPKDAERLKQLTAGISTEAVAEIENVQPYRLGDFEAVRAHPLWQLGELSNIDKHRRIPIHSNATDIGNVFTLRTLSSVLECRIENHNPVIVLPLALKGQVGLNPKTRVQVFFGDSSERIQIDFAGLERIYDFVTEDVLPRFVPFFGSLRASAMHCSTKPWHKDS